MVLMRGAFMKALDWQWFALAVALLIAARPLSAQPSAARTDPASAPSPASVQPPVARDDRSGIAYGPNTRLLDGPVAHGDARAVVLRHSEFVRLQERQRGLDRARNESGQNGLPANVILSRATYTARVHEDRADVTARFDCSTLHANDPKPVDLVGGPIAVLDFTPPFPEGSLIFQDRTDPSEVPEVERGEPAFAFLTEKVGSGELGLRFVTSVVTEGAFRRFSFTVPRVPLSSIDLALRERGVSVRVDPSAGVEDASPLVGYGIHRTARLKMGREVVVTWIRPKQPEQTKTPSSQTSGPKPRIVVDRAMALYTLAEDRLRVRTVMDVDVSAAPVNTLTLHTGPGVEILGVEEVGSSRMLDDCLSATGSERFPGNTLLSSREGRVELRFRSSFQGQVRLVVNGETRCDPQRAEVEVCPFFIEEAQRLRDGFVAFASLVPAGLEAIGSDGTRPIPSTLLPAEFGQSPSPILHAFHCRAPRASFRIVLHRSRVVERLTGLIEKVEVVTSLLGQVGFTSHYKLTLAPGSESDLDFCFADPEKNLPQGLACLVKTPGGEGFYRVPLDSGGGRATNVEFDVLHPGERLNATGTVSLRLARFALPIDRLSWKIMEPSSFRFFDYHGPFIDLPVPPSPLLQNLVLSTWSWAIRMVEAAVDPSTLMLLLVGSILFLALRSYVTGQVSFSLTWAQLLTVLGTTGVVIMVAAAVIHLTTTSIRPATDADAVFTRGKGGAQEPTDKTGTPTQQKGPEGRTPEKNLSESTGPLTGPIQEASGAGASMLPPAPPKGMAEEIQRPEERPARADSVSLAQVGSDQGLTLSRGFWIARRGEPRPSDSIEFQARYIQRRYEWIPNTAATLAGFFVFCSLFFVLRTLLSQAAGLSIGFGALLIGWYLDARYPFTANFVAVGFASPLFLVGLVRLAGFTMEVVEGWREEAFVRATEETREQWQADRSRTPYDSFIGARDQNEVSIREIFTDATARQPIDGTDPTRRGRSGPSLGSGGDGKAEDPSVSGGREPSAADSEIDFVTGDEDEPDGAQQLQERGPGKGTPP